MIGVSSFCGREIFYLLVKKFEKYIVTSIMLVAVRRERGLVLLSRAQLCARIVACLKNYLVN